MKDPILRALGIRDRDSLSADSFDVVVDHLAHFARGGGWVTWDLWRRLKTDTRAALMAAFERIKAEDAAAVGLASQGPKEAAQILSAADGGDLSCELTLDEFVEKLAKKS